MEKLGGLRKPDPAFWQNKRVLITGHTGFKGAWLTLWLNELGADVTGLALAPSTEPSMYELAGIEDKCVSMIADIRDTQAVTTAIATAKPQVVIHMAAQTLVQVGWEDPSTTFSTNVMGTVNVLEALTSGVTEMPMACVVVTSDKVYAKNDNAEGGFIESDPLGGDDPYSASKAATEMVVAAYRRKFTENGRCILVSARGGNVVGGGDFSPHRLVPDIWRSCQKEKPLTIRMPEATRPWQHVLDCLLGYILYVESVAIGEDVPEALNIGPKGDGLTVREVSKMMHEMLLIKYQAEPGVQFGELKNLKIDSSLARNSLRWQPRLEDGKLWDWTGEWYSALILGSDYNKVINSQLSNFNNMGK